MKFTLDTYHPPKHSLIVEERNFPQRLSAYRLPLDKSLVFQINDLQRHTELVLSGDSSYVEDVVLYGKLENLMAYKGK